MTAPNGFLPELHGWIADVTGGWVDRAERLPGGNRRQAWMVDVHYLDGARQELFLRHDVTDAPSAADHYTLAREGVLGRALGGTGVRVPAVVATHPQLQAVLTERVSGDAGFYRIADPLAKTAIAQDFMAQVAALHRIDPDRFDLPGVGPLAPLPMLVHRELDIWEGMYRETDRLDPMVELGFRWLRTHVPQVEGPVVLVHGDCGPGNFLFQGDAVTAVLDWELAHLGDPMEDLAWLSLRTAQETFPDFAGRLTEYERLVGWPIDADRLRYHRVFAQLRILVLRNRAHGQASHNGDIGNGLLSAGLHRRLFVEALADVLGTDLEPPELPNADPGPRDWLFEAAIVQLRDVVVARSTDSLVESRAKGIARVLKYLRNADRLGPQLAQDDCADLEALLGHPVGSAGAGREELAVAIRGGAFDDIDLIRCLARLMARETHLLRPAMGALADRHHPSIPETP